MQLYSVTKTCTLYTAVMGSMGRPLAVSPGQVACSDTVLGAGFEVGMSLHFRQGRLTGFDGW